MSKFWKLLIVVAIVVAIAVVAFVGVRYINDKQNEVNANEEATVVEEVVEAQEEQVVEQPEVETETEIEEVNNNEYSEE